MSRILDRLDELLGRRGEFARLGKLDVGRIEVVKMGEFASLANVYGILANLEM